MERNLYPNFLSIIVGAANVEIQLLAEDKAPQGTNDALLLSRNEMIPCGKRITRKQLQAMLNTAKGSRI